MAPGRAARPGASPDGGRGVGTGDPCPFCPGNEAATLPAVATEDREGQWSVRVVPNLYPAFSGDGPFTPVEAGPVFCEADAVGVHEVVILSPDHGRAWSALDDEQAALVMAVLRDRHEAHARLPDIVYTQAFVNHGREAGASVAHPHGQLLGIPFVPDLVLDELAGFARHHELHDACVLCQTVDAERTEGTRVVIDTGRVVVVCPYWSGTPFELLVVPTDHVEDLTRATPPDLSAVGLAVRDALAALDAAVGDVAYNLVFHTAPHDHAGGPFHWHLHVLPRITNAAGFEQGTGVLINVVAPEDAAAELRSAVPRPPTA